MLIYDLGANSGEDTAAYLAAGHEVVAVEPNPALVTTLNARFAAEIAAGRVHIEDGALGDPEWPKLFHVSANDHWSSIDPIWAGRDGLPTTAIEVPTITLPDLFERYGCPDYIKIDVEGADRIVLEQLLGDKRRPGLVSVEDCRFGPTYLDILAACGYTGFKLSEQSRLPPGTSGPFGEDLPGPWLTIDEMRALYAEVVRDGGMKMAPTGVYFDIHAKLGR